MNTYDILPPLFRPTEGRRKGQDSLHSDKGGALPPTPFTPSVDAIPSTGDCVENRVATQAPTTLGGRDWPDALPELGVRSIGVFTLCRDCRPDRWRRTIVGYDRDPETGWRSPVVMDTPEDRGTWARYGTVPLCLGCARARAACSRHALVMAETVQQEASA